MMKTSDIGEQLGVALEHEEVFTVSRLILMLLERQPRVGDSVIYASIRLEVTAIEGHGVGQSSATLRPPDEQRSAETD